MKQMLLAATLVVAISAPVFAMDGGDSSQTSTTALEHQASARAQVELQTAPVRSLQDLHKFIALNRGRATPLDALAPTTRQPFLDGITFNEKGVTGLNLLPLRGLTASQAYAVLSLFGMQRLTGQIKEVRVENELDKKIMSTQPGSTPFMAIHEGYRCVARGSCAPAFGYACTSNC